MKTNDKSMFWNSMAVILGACLLLINIPNIVHSEEAKVRIGAAVSLTGSLAREGGYVKKGYDTWAEWVNQQGGIKVAGKPYKVEMVYYDDKADATTSAKLTEKLITEDKVNMVLGPYSSGITAATSAICEKYGYVNISPMSSGDFLYERGFKYIFSVLNVSTRALFAGSDMIAKQNPKPKTFAIAVMDSTFTLPVCDGAAKRLTELGLKSVYYGKYAPNTTDFSGMLASIKAEQPDIVITAGFFPHAVAFIRQAKELKVDAKLFITTGAADTPDWVPVMKMDGEYVLSTSPWQPDMGYKDKYFSSQSFYDFWLKKYGEPVTSHSAAAFTTGILMQNALEKAGSLEQAKVRDALRALDMETFFGKFKFDEAGRNIGAWTGVIQIQNQKSVSVEPPRAKLIYPTPAWKDR